MGEVRYFLFLLRQSFSATVTDPRTVIVLSTAMFLQNALFFTLWMVLFSSIHQIRGWHLSQLAVFMGALNIAVGLGGFFGTGSRWIGQKILSGDLDVYLARPRHPLPQFLTMLSDPSTPGDVLYGLLLLLAFAHLTPYQLALALAASIILAVLVVAVSVLFQSLAFFFAGGAYLGDEIYSTMFAVGSVPQHTQGMVFKLILFTVLPAGFMVIVPVELVQQQSLGLLLILAVCVIGYMALAALVFERGLKHYTSATGWSA